MPNIIVVILALVFLCTSCQSEKKEKEIIKTGTKTTSFYLGKNIFNGKGKCHTCHKINAKSIGPSILDIMKIYKEQNANLIAFLKQEKGPIVDPETYAVMKTNFVIINRFSEVELQALQTYMTQVNK